MKRGGTGRIEGMGPENGRREGKEDTEDGEEICERQK